MRIRAISAHREFNGAMRFRTGVIVGLALGYYYGTKAGHERHEQIEKALEGFRHSRAYRELRAAALLALDEGRARAIELVSEVTAPAEDLDRTLEMRTDPSWN